MTWVSGLSLLHRADANRTIGAGHAMRLASLGRAWLEGDGRVGFAGSIELPFVRDRLERSGLAPGDRWVARADVLVVDTYDPALHRTAGPDAALRVLVDDLGGAVPPGFDAVWNPNAYGSASLYPGFGGAVIAGPEHVAIRDDLLPWEGRVDQTTVVSLGGGSPPARVREALAHLGGLMPDQAFAITGEWAPSGWRMIPPDQLWPTARRATRLVTAAGITVWEAAAAGIPVLLLQTAPNQRLVFGWARDAGAPGLDTQVVEPDSLARALAGLIPSARPLPPLTNGAGRVARCLARLVTQGKAA
jgi:hypothetical protein